MIEKVQIIKSVEKKIKDGNYKEALGEITRCLELYPTFIVAKVLKAECLYYLDNYEEALALLSEVLFAAPDNIKARKLAIETNLKLGNIDEAKTHLDFLSFILPANHPYIDEARSKIEEAQKANVSLENNDDLKVEYKNVEALSEKEEALGEDDEELLKSGHQDMDSSVVAETLPQGDTNQDSAGNEQALMEGEVEDRLGESQMKMEENELKNHQGKTQFDSFKMAQSIPENKSVDTQNENDKVLSQNNAVMDKIEGEVVDKQELSEDDFLLHSEDIDSVSHSTDEDDQSVSESEGKKISSKIEELQEDNLITGVLPEQISTITLPEKEEEVDIKTKTLALIYERQGMFEEALEILEKLFNENGDESLIKDIERIKAKMMGKGENAIIVNKIKILEDWLERVKWHSSN